MVLETAVPILIVLILVLISWAVFKKLFKIFFYIGIIMIILIGLNGFFFYQDISDLRKNFATSTKKVILVDKDEVLTGFLLKPEVSFIEESQLEDFSKNLKENNLEDMLGTSYKLMVFDIGIISDIENEKIEIGDKSISKESAITILKSDKPSDKLEIEGISLKEYGADSEAEVKAVIFGIILADDILNSKNPLFFLSEFKKGNIMIYPKTALFKAVKYIPVAFFKSAAKKIFLITKDKAKSFVVEEYE